MKKDITRKDFLRLAALGTGAVTLSRYLAACSSSEKPAPEAASLTSPEPSATRRLQTPNPDSITTGTPTTPQTLPDLVVARGGEPEQLVRRALASLGGMEAFVPKNTNVIIKPNICVAYHSYEYAATTNPWVVGALVKLCFEAGAKAVRVLDHPFGGRAEQAYKISGIEEQVKAAGGDMLVLPNFSFVPVAIQNGKSLTQVEIYDDVLKADVLINVPIAKHHNLARLTLGMKNLMGVIKNRTAIHADIGQRLADLTSLIRPSLTVIDAVRILMDHGPTGGSLDDVKQIDTVIASPDIVAADGYAASLFGLQPTDLEYVSAGAAMGLGQSDLGNLNIEEIVVGG